MKVHQTTSHPIVEASPRLAKVLADLISLGASSFGALYDRQNLGPIGDRITLGPPGRLEFNAVSNGKLPVVNLATHGCLALGNDPRVRRGAVDALEKYGTHTGGTRALSGTTGLHCDLEERLAAFVGSERVVTYSSAYAAAVSVLSTLFGPGDLIILDRYAHRSLYDGAMLSRARIRRFAHNDLDHLDHILRSTGSVSRRLVVVDSVYSMEGHLAPLPALVDLARRHGAFLLADEAHAFGLVGPTGRGAAEHFAIDPGSIDIRIGSLSKAIPAIGGFAAVDASIAILLRYVSQGRAFSAAMTPPDAGAALEAVRILEKEPERVRLLQRNASVFRSELTRSDLDTFGSETAIVPVRVGDRMRTLTTASTLLERGVYVNPIIAPGVPSGRERLRCLVTAAHSEDDLKFAAATIGEVLDSKPWTA